MIYDKKPSVYSDRSTIGSAEDLDAYGVWVKSEPQDIAGLAGGDDDYSAPYEAAYDAGFDIPESEPSQAGADGYDADDAYLSGDYTGDGFDSEMASGRGDEVSTQLLMKIADELSSIRSELTTLKKEFADIRAGAGHIATDDVDTHHIEDTALHSDFFSADEDEKTTLSGAEMDNILSSANLSESANLPEEENFNFDPLREEDEAALRELSGKNEAAETVSEPEHELGGEHDLMGMDFAPLPLENSLDPFGDFSLSDLPEVSELSGLTDESLEISDDFSIPETLDIETEMPEVSVEPPEAAEVSVEPEPEPEPQPEPEPEPPEVSPEPEVEAEPEADPETPEVVEEEILEEGLPEEEPQEPELEPLPEQSVLDEEIVKSDDDKELDVEFASSLDEDDELQTLRLEGATPLTPPPEDLSYFEADPVANNDLTDISLDDTGFDLSLDDFTTDQPEEKKEEEIDELKALEDTNLDLSNAVIDDPDLSKESSLDDISLSMDKFDLGDDFDEKDDGLVKEDDLDSIGSLDIKDVDFSLDDFGDIEGESSHHSSFKPDTSDDDALKQIIPEGYEINAQEAAISLDDDLEAFVDDDDILPAADEPVIPEEPAAEASAEANIEENVEPKVEEKPEEKIDADPSTAVEETGIPEGIKTELKNVLSYMDHLLESLPEEKIEEFAKSEYYDSYKKLFEDLGLA